MKKNKNNKIWILIIVLLVILTGLIILCFFIRNSSSSAKKSYNEYSRHYAMISDEEDTDFWNKVYESAHEYGDENDVYVERFGSNLAVKYSKNELLKLAIQANVDGIIVKGDESQETIDLINEAISGGIPVATVYSDCSGSNRQCYIGINNYNLGQQYGDQINEILKDNDSLGSDTVNVLVLTNTEQTDVSQNLILLGIRDEVKKLLGTDYPIQIQTTSIDNSKEFSAEESISDIFIDADQLPDIMICLSELHTKCAYRAAVDYNKVGKVEIIGYYDSSQILEAISKNIIYSSITIDTEQMGYYCVKTLNEYIRTGYTNGYIPVEAELITNNEASKLLSNMRGDADEEN